MLLAVPVQTASSIFRGKGDFMKAFVKNGIVVGIYTTEQNTPTDCDETVLLMGRQDIPSLGWSYDGTTFTEPVLGQREAPRLESLKEVALKLIDGCAELVRTTNIGSLEHQLSIYSAKYYDAKAYKLSAFGKSTTEYRWIAAEMSATGCTADQAADRFIEKYTQLTDTLTKSEELRINGKAAIREAKSVDELIESRSETLLELRALVAQP